MPAPASTLAARPTTSPATSASDASSLRSTAVTPAQAVASSARATQVVKEPPVRAHGYRNGDDDHRACKQHQSLPSRQQIDGKHAAPGPKRKEAALRVAEPQANQQQRGHCTGSQSHAAAKLGCKQ